jgi:hypothetical protein
MVRVMAIGHELSGGLAGRFEERGTRGEVVGGLVVWREMGAGAVREPGQDGGGSG